MSVLMKLGKRRGSHRGQAMVEFSLAIIVFLVMLMGLFDLGRAVFMYNGVSEAAREIARRAAVWPYQGLASTTELGSSTQVRETVATQKTLVPGMNNVSVGSPDFECVDISGDISTNTTCGQGDFRDYVRVTVSATYNPISLLGLSGPITLEATSTVSFPKRDVSS
jgi:Flp pilus assembly protein TadG